MFAEPSGLRLWIEGPVMFVALTGAGLSAAAGLNAYIPFLLVALLARFTDVFALPSGFGWISSTPAIIIAALLLVVEIVVDKIPALDSVNDVLGSVVRPASGAVVFAATAAAANLDNSGWLGDNPWVGAIGGAIVAGLFHTGKAVARPAANLGSAGMAAPLMSLGEDLTSVLLSLAAVFVPLVALVVLLVAAYALWKLWRQVASMRAARDVRRSRTEVVR